MSYIYIDVWYELSLRQGDLNLKTDCTAMCIVIYETPYHLPLLKWELFQQITNMQK